jgi:aminopeptidase N
MLERAQRIACLAALGALACLGLPAGAQESAGPSRRGVDVLDYALTLDLPDTGSTIEGRAVLTVLRIAKVDTLHLDLVALRVDSVLVAGRAVSFARDSTSIGVPLPPLGASAGDTLPIAIRYGGAPRDGLIIRTDSLGHWTAFGDNWPQRARYWIPSVDEPSDKATVSWSVSAPSDRRVVANGELREEVPLPRSGRGMERTLTRWRERHPIPTYTMVIAAAPLAYYDLGRAACGRGEMGGCVHQAVYVQPELLGYLPGPFARAGEIVSWLAALVAPFPFERLDHLQSLTRFGGMENATAIFYADQSFRDRSLDEETVAHETAHQWFGDGVTEQRFADLWLSEGFATYWAQLWVRHAYGDSAFRAGMARMREEIIKSPVTAQRPVRDTIETDYLKLLNTNSYQKGAWVLHMLRGMLGDSAFFRGIRSYYQAHRYSNATTADLRRALEQSSGRPLGWFFDQWLNRPGFAELTTTWHYDAARRRVLLTVVQGDRFGPYRLPLTIELRDSSGRPHLTTVQLAAQKSQSVELPLRVESEPREVTVDPGGEVLGRVVGG